MNTHRNDYKKYVNEYAQLGMDGTFYLAFRDIPKLLGKYVRGEKALDYGCGAGRSTRFLKRLNYNTIGVDISLDMLKKARMQDEQGTYIHIESGIMPFDNVSFDVVFSSFVFMEVASLEEIQSILLEMKRILTKNGIIVFVTLPVEGFKGDWVSFSYDFPENDKNLKSGDKVKVFIRETDIILNDYFWTEQDYRAVIEKAGLRLVDLLKPMGKHDDKISWLDEMTSPYIGIYVLSK